MNIENYGFSPTIINENTTATPARITAVHRGKFEFVCQRGMGFAHLKSNKYYAGNELFPTTGDFVLLDLQEKGESLIIKTLERKTCFSRLDPSSSGYKEQTVAANFDYVFIVQSLDNNFNPRRLERYLTLAWQSGAIPVVILTKADIAQDSTTQLHIAQNLAVGANVILVSAKTGYGMDALNEYLKPGKTIVFLGSSGVGKSSLVNALVGKEVMPTNEIREKDGRGKHTTTHRQLILLNSGVMIIDTPGMRELGMWDANEGLSQNFSDVEQYIGKCKFSDCSHENEPKCAIKSAIQSGLLSIERWESYVKLQNETRFNQDKESYLRQKQQWHKSISKMIKQKKEIDYRHQPCSDTFECKVCGKTVAPEQAGSQHRNHCPHCLSSVHLDNKPGDRLSLCKGIMEPIGVWVRKNGEWAVIHRCKSCGVLSSNRIAADDNQTLLISIAAKPISSPPFPLWNLQ